MTRGRQGGRVVVAGDSFKGSLGSADVGASVRRGVLDVVPHAVVDVVAVADGGDGTVRAVLSAGWDPVSATVSGPTGEPVEATLAVRDLGDGSGRWVLAELADACGLERLPGGVPAPLTASSRGLGEAVRAALDLEPDRLLVGVGGSASTDGGAGMLAALGARVLDAAGREVGEGGAALAAVRDLRLDGLDPRLAGLDLVVLADVDNPLLGPDGAAAVFGPQKGATAAEVAVLEAALTQWASVVSTSTGGRAPEAHRMPGSGAAGGVGFALMAVLGAGLRSGIESVLELVHLEDHLGGARLVVTGEGSLDAQTSRGKAVAGIASRATASGVPVVAVCGRSLLSRAETDALGLAAVYPLAELEPDLAASMAGAAGLLRRTGRRIAREWLSGPG